jgi:diacylglycerol kinase family enzyme
VGFGVEVVKDSPENTKKYAGTLAYPVSIAKLLWAYKPRLCELVADGQRIKKRVMILAVANGRAVGRGLFIAPRAEASTSCG